MTNVLYVEVFIDAFNLPYNGELVRRDSDADDLPGALEGAMRAGIKPCLERRAQSELRSWSWQVDVVVPVGRDDATGPMARFKNRRG